MNFLKSFFHHNIDENKFIIECYNAYYEYIYLYLCKSCKNQEIAKDLTQDVFLSFTKIIKHGKFPPFTKEEQILAYLLRAAKNKLINRSRKKANQTIELTNIVKPIQSLTASIDSKIDWEALSRILSEEEKNLYHLKMEGYSYKEISVKTGKSPEAIKQAFYRTKKELQKSIE